MLVCFNEINRRIYANDQIWSIRGFIIDVKQAISVKFLQLRLFGAISHEQESQRKVGGKKT